MDIDLNINNYSYNELLNVYRITNKNCEENIKFIINHKLYKS